MHFFSICDFKAFFYALMIRQTEQKNLRPIVRILCIEDHKTMQKVIELMLAPLEVDIVFCSDGKEGFEAFFDGPYDLILCDFELPHLRGDAVIAKIRTQETLFHLSRTPIILVSGKGATDDARSNFIEKIDADDFLTKPFCASDLINMCDRVMSAVHPSP